MFRLVKTVLVLSMCFHVVQSFYFPGVAPNEFELGTELTIKAVKMTSVKTQLSYYYYSLKFCKPEGKLEHRPENLGEILRGDRIVNTPYSLTVGKRIECRLLCETELSNKEVAEFSEKITDGYVLHMLVDNLPAATVFKNLDTGEFQYEDGFKIGFEMQKDLFLYNHLHFIIEYHPVQTNEQTVYRIVGFQVEPRNIAPESLKIDSSTNKCTLPSVKEADIQKLMKKGMKKVAFTYSVEWVESPLAWASRWDTYLKMSDVEVHWHWLLTYKNVGVVLYLSLLLTIIWVGKHRRRLTLDEALEETGWKLVHGDVFRPPQYPMLLIAMLNTIPILCIVVIVLVFAMFGMLSPASRGALMTAATVLFMFMGPVSGYHVARMYRSMRGAFWKRMAAMQSHLEIIYVTLYTDDTLEETGRKLVHGDVFRPPQYPMLLTAMLGSGVLVFLMAFDLLLVVFAMCGTLDPASQYVVLRLSIILFMFLGLYSVYYSAKMYGTMKRTDLKAAVLASDLYPGVVFGTLYTGGIPPTTDFSGWKLVHGDVFRPPQYPMLLTAMLGSGIQILCMVVIILVFAMFGMLSPASRGALITAAIVLFMFMGLVSGYHSARMYRTMRGTHWKRAAVMTSALYPGVVFGTGFFLNLFIWGEHSSGAVPFTTLIALVALWAGIALPLVFCGFYFGFRKQPYDHPVRTNQIPRQIPDQVWYLSPVFSSLIAGILPFGVFFVELFFVLSAIWENHFYFSILSNSFLDFFTFFITISLITIMIIYVQLCKENYHWWWKSFFLSGSCAFYFSGYSFVYYWTKLEIEDFIPTLLYFGYTSMMVFGFWLLTGTIGFYATYFFIRKIYAAVKQDNPSSI